MTPNYEIQVNSLKHSLTLKEELKAGEIEPKSLS
jgi:hypothetical protein